MARFFKPLLGAVALAAATLTSTGALAQSYAYNAQITITAPKGSAAEAASKDKSKPTGVKFTGCAADINVGSISIKNPDFLQFSVKYDAGKTAGQIGDVYLVLQNLTVAGAANRYYVVERTSGLSGGLTLKPAADLAALEALVTPTTPPSSIPVGATFLSKQDNLGTGAQTEVLFGGNLALAGLPKGLWAMSLIIAPPTAVYDTPGTTTMPTNSFLFGRPDTWAAHDTVVFQLGSPFQIDTASQLLDADGVAAPAANANCE